MFQRPHAVTGRVLEEPGVKRVLLAAAVAVVAAAGAFLFFRGAPERGKGDPLDSVWLPAGPQAIIEIGVRRASDEFALKRVGEQWQLVLPGGIPPLRADAEKVNILLDHLTLNKPKRQRLLAAGDESRFGLSSPRLVLAVRMADPSGSAEEKEVLIGVGERTETGDGVYAVNSLGREALFILPLRWEHPFAQPVELLADTRVVETDDRNMSRIAMTDAAGRRLEVYRKKESYYFMAPPELADQEATASEVKLVLGSLAALRAEQFVPGDKGIDPEAPASLVVQAWPHKVRTPERLEIFDANAFDRFVLARSSWQPGWFLLDREAVRGLFRTEFDLMDRTVVGFDASDAQSFRLTMGTRLFAAEKAPSGWVESGSGWPVQGIDMTLWRLSELQFEAAPLESLPETAVWDTKCEVLDAAGHELLKATFFFDSAMSPDRCWLKAGGDKRFFPVSSRLLMDMKGQFVPR